MWLILAFVSAALLGLYDTSKKASLKDNAVLPVLLINTALSTLFFSPFLTKKAGPLLLTAKKQSTTPLPLQKDLSPTFTELILITIQNIAMNGLRQVMTIIPASALILKRSLKKQI